MLSLTALQLELWPSQHLHAPPNSGRKNKRSKKTTSHERLQDEIDKMNEKIWEKIQIGIQIGNRSF